MKDAGYYRVLLGTTELKTMAPAEVAHFAQEVSDDNEWPNDPGVVIDKLLRYIHELKASKLTEG